MSLPSSILFQSPDSSVLLLDIPRSLEEAQVLPGQPPRARIYSDAPPAEPFRLPEPKDGASTDWPPPSPAAQVADLMASAAAQNALDQLSHGYSGPFCLPRFSPPDSGAASPEEPVKIPHGAEYLNGSIQEMRQTFLDKAPQFRLIVLDPPWPNRSARRRTDSYNTVANLIEMRQLLSNIPIPSHLADDGLVAMWITNKPSILEFLTSPTGLFASWGLELVTEWTWLKIIVSGEPLFDMESQWRKPWERLLIARRVGSRTPLTPKSQVIVAVPDTHSRKPNLRGLFQDILGEGYPALEVFARTLTAGWWSWGNEVLRFQGPQHWTAVE
ncbi:hypothetical protein PT974_12062 [Cladobotryum mycophilum]|uniref:MT-A70-domain-containing protein n=1 Tax=Cladobotryum mycophilum TaxID=491253 RepID=A0ABR0S6Z8_9HYPO